jgi:hypothetical protein
LFQRLILRTPVSMLFRRGSKVIVEKLRKCRPEQHIDDPIDYSEDLICGLRPLEVARPLPNHRRRHEFRQKGRVNCLEFRFDHTTRPFKQGRSPVMQ